MAADGEGADADVLAVLSTNGVAYDLEDPVTTIGRSPECDIVLRGSRSISSRHARIVVNNVNRRDAVLEDMGSLNGCFVNDTRVKGRKLPLRTGDRIKFGYDASTYMFEFPADKRPAVKPDMTKVPPHLRESVQAPTSFVQAAGRETAGDRAMMPDRSRSPSRVRRRELHGAGESMASGFGSHYRGASPSPSRRPRSSSRPRSASSSRPRSAAAARGGTGSRRGRGRGAGSRRSVPPSKKGGAASARGRPRARKAKKTAAGGRTTTSLKDRVRARSKGKPNRKGDGSVIAHTATGRRSVSPSARAPTPLPDDQGESKLTGWDKGASHGSHAAAMMSDEAVDRLFDETLRSRGGDGETKSGTAAGASGEASAGAGGGAGAGAGAGGAGSGTAAADPLANMMMMAPEDEDEEGGGDFALPPGMGEEEDEEGGDQALPPSPPRGKATGAAEGKADGGDAVVMQHAPPASRSQRDALGASGAGGGGGHATPVHGSGADVDLTSGGAARGVVSGERGYKQAPAHTQGQARNPLLPAGDSKAYDDGGGKASGVPSTIAAPSVALADPDAVQKEATLHAERAVTLAHAQARVEELTGAVERLTASVDAKEAAMKELEEQRGALARRMNDALAQKETELRQLRDVHRSSIEKMATEGARRDLEMKTLRTRSAQESRRLEAAVKLKEQQLDDLRALMATSSRHVGLVALQRWMDARGKRRLREAWSRWAFETLQDKVRASRTREAAMSTALREASTKLEMLMHNDWARELMRQQEQVAALKQELADALERNRRERLDYAAAVAGVQGSTARPPPGGAIVHAATAGAAGGSASGSGPPAEYPAALHPESSAHTQRLVDAAVADAVGTAMREWQHERRQLMSALADRDRQVFRLARSVAAVAQQGADRKRQEAARLLVAEVQRLQTRERDLVAKLSSSANRSERQQHHHHHHAGGADDSRRPRQRYK